MSDRIMNSRKTRRKLARVSAGGRSVLATKAQVGDQGRSDQRCTGPQL